MLSRHSHQKVQVKCDVQISEKCKKEYLLEYREVINNKERNAGKLMCFYCSREIKYTGRNNPNCKHKNVDDNFFSIIDSPDKAYILGWIASDGNISASSWTIRIAIHKRDIDVLEYIQKKIKVGKIANKNENMISISLSSKQCCIDICNLLNIKRGKKSFNVQFPYSIPKEFYRYFIQGYFEGDGFINGIFTKIKRPLAGISSSSKKMLESIKDVVNIHCLISDNKKCEFIHYWSSNALDFLKYIYNHNNFKMNRKYALYQAWLTYEKTLVGSSIKRVTSLNKKIKVCKTHKNAILPTKAHKDNAGYDLCIIEKIKDINNNTALYSTGLKFQFFEEGWYLHMYARNSLIKMGYVLTNSVGIIDPGFLGTVLVSLTKINPDSPDIELPAKIAQIIPQELHSLDLHEVLNENFLETSREDGGFGSSYEAVEEIKKMLGLMEDID